MTPEDPDAQQPPSVRLEHALARLDALINWERKGRGRMRVTLDPARDLCERLGHPERGPRVVHVAGSKGKGSVAALVAAALQAAGLRVGRYASPHVERIQERVVLEGREVADDVLARGIERALAARAAALAEDTPARDATWFDLLTAAAWCAFAESSLDVLVVECGLGGRFDSTNTVDGEVAVLTNVELEHTNVLGTTRAAIAGEKVGILKPGATLVTGVPADDEAGRVLDARAAALGVPVLRPAPPAGAARGFESWNLALAGEVLAELGRRGLLAANGAALGAAHLGPEVVRAARLPARLELLRRGEVPVVLDGAHTPGSVRCLLEELSLGRLDGLPRPLGRPVALFGVARDKDLPGLLKSLRGGVDSLVCTSVGAAHARPASEIAAAARELELPVETADTPQVALERCLELAGPRGWILVLGSLYLAGALRPLLATIDPAPPAC